MVKHVILWKLKDDVIAKAAVKAGQKNTLFRDEYIAHIQEHKCPAKVCKNMVHYEIDPEKCRMCSACARRCPASAISGEMKKTPFSIDQTKCLKCGACMTSCKFGAVSKKS